jgi:hypothetical protein
VARATRQEQTGSVGASEAAAAFARIGWGHAEVTRHDNGIDFFLMARDARGFDLGLTVGAQIKAGPWYFRRPKRQKGEVVGWWYHDQDGEHLADLLAHGLPQLIVLHDDDDRATYWVHVTTAAVVSTGKGARILVPRTQTVDEDHRAALIEVAGAARRAQGWEGSAWTGATELPERDLLRTALLAPRLVAPHGNAGHSATLTAPAAAALLMQARVRDLAAFAERNADTPNLEEAVTHTDWGWQLVGRLGRRVTTGETDQFRALIDTAPTPTGRAGVLALYAGGLLEEDRPEEAIELLEEHLERDDLAPVDHAWLTVQLARAVAEVGDTQRALQLAGSVQGLQYAHPFDVTAVALEGIGAQMLFQLSGVWDGDVSLAIRGRDTAVSWWRQQTRSWGLGAVLDHAFEQWARDERVWWARSDSANDMLVSASLTATTAGDQYDWRYLIQALGRSALFRLQVDHQGQSAVAGLVLLRLAGDHEGLALALQHLLAEGPALDAREFASGFDPRRSTRTTARSTFAIYKAAGPVLDEETATTVISWLLELLQNPDGYTIRTGYEPESHLILESLASVLRAANSSSHREVAEYFLAAEPSADQLAGDRWAAVLRQIDPAAWSGLRERLRGRAHAEQASELLEYACLGIVVTEDAAERQRLEDEIAAGSHDALGAYGPVDTLSSPTVAAFLKHADAALVAEMQRARGGMYGFGGPDWLDAVVLLNRWHPDTADWRPVLQVLQDPAIRQSSKVSALGRLAQFVPVLPPELIESLRGLTRQGSDDAKDRAFVGSTTSDDSYEGAFALLQLALGEHDAAANDLLGLLDGQPRDRIWAARLAAHRGDPIDIGTLATMSRDPDARVRAAVAGALVHVATKQPLPAVGVQALMHLADDPGLLVPRALAAELAGHPSSEGVLPALEVQLKGHPLQPVRRKLAVGDESG